MKFIGNHETRRLIAIATAGAKDRNESVPHMLFSGAAGCGKTTLAKRVATYSDVNFISMLPQTLKTMDDVLDLFRKLDHTNYDIRGNKKDVEKPSDAIKPSIIFIDEIHNLSLQPQEWLGIAMEDFEIESKESGKHIWFPYFTLIGATTDDGKLSKPFRDRFKLRFVFKPYTSLESAEIVLSHAQRLSIDITIPAAQKIAQRGRGVPRILVGYLERTRDMAYICKSEVVTPKIVEETFASLGVDEMGLTETELKILQTLYGSKDPVGLDNLSIITNEASKTILTSIEPFLIQKGFIIRTGKGRRITNIGRRYWEKTHNDSKNIEKVEIEAGYARK